MKKLLFTALMMPFFASAYGYKADLYDFTEFCTHKEGFKMTIGQANYLSGLKHGREYNVDFVISMHDRVFDRYCYTLEDYVNDLRERREEFIRQ